MASQFEKRKKSAEAVSKEIEAKRSKLREKGTMEKESPIQETPLEKQNRMQNEIQVQKQAMLDQQDPFYPHKAYDIFTSDGGKTYQVAEIEYNASTGHARVIETFNITRLVALSYANQKIALGTLKKGKK